MSGGGAREELKFTFGGRGNHSRSPTFDAVPEQCYAYVTLQLDTVNLVAYTV